MKEIEKQQAGLNKKEIVQELERLGAEWRSLTLSGIDQVVDRAIERATINPAASPSEATRTS